MQEKQLLDVLLTLEKHAAVNYALFANECSTESLRNDVMNILNDQHKLQFEIFDLMSSKGFYQTEVAETAKIDKAKQKFAVNNN